jgi:hypothetical protein
MLKIGMQNKQYGISFEIAIFSTNKITAPKLSSCLLFLISNLEKEFKYMTSNNYISFN